MMEPHPYNHALSSQTPLPLPPDFPKPGKAPRDPSRYYMPLHVSSRFGVRLRQLRKERSWTQVRMAKDFGIDRTFISDVERGRKSISLGLLEIIALGMKISLSDLLRNL